MARRESTAGPGSRAIVVDYIRSSGPVSRGDLVAATALTQPSISNIVRKLIDEEIVVEAGRTLTTGARTSKLLSINARGLFAIGMHVSDTEVTCVATDMTAAVVARQKTNRSSGSTEALALDLVNTYSQFVDLLGTEVHRIAGLSIVAPPSFLVAIDRDEVRAELVKRTGHPVVIESAALAATMGEYWSRQVSRDQHFACIFLDDVIESGVVIGGSPMRGFHRNAGRLGHISVDRNGPLCECGSRGCLNLYASPRAVIAAASELAQAAMAPIKLGGAAVADDFDLLGRAAMNGNDNALALIVGASIDLGQAVASMNALIDLSAVVVTGPASAVVGPTLVRGIRDALGRAGAHDLAKNVSLSESPRDAAAIGAAAWLLQSTVSPGHDSATATAGTAPRET